MNNKLDLNNNISTEVNNPYLNATKTIQDNQYKTSLDTVIKQVKKYKLLFWIFLITTILYTVFVVYINYIANFYDIQYNKYAESLNKNDHYKTINTTNENSYTSEIMLLGNTIYYKINDSYIEDLNTYELIKYLNDVNLEIPIFDDYMKKINIKKDKYYKSKLKNVIDMHEVSYIGGKKIFFLTESGEVYYFNTNQKGTGKEDLFDSHHNLNLQKIDVENIISVGCYDTNHAYAIDIEGNIFKIG